MADTPITALKIAVGFAKFPDSDIAAGVTKLMAELEQDFSDGEYEPSEEVETATMELNESVTEYMKEMDAAEDADVVDPADDEEDDESGRDDSDDDDDEDEDEDEDREFDDDEDDDLDDEDELTDSRGEDDDDEEGVTGTEQSTEEISRNT